MTAQGIGHGKIILLGEHSVVHGRPALAAAIARGCHATAERAAENMLAVEPWGARVYTARQQADAKREELRQAFDVLCKKYDETLSVSAVMEIPSGAGLGGSAALSVAIIRACDSELGIERPLEDVIALSLDWERVFHGNPSGVDSAMAARGGVAWFRKGEPIRPRKVAQPASFVVGNSGEHGSTKLTVGSVAGQLERNREKIEKIFDAIADLVDEGVLALERGRLERFGELMDFNQQLLNALLLSTPKLEEMCKAARGAGALGAKLTGGGGGGCMIALARDSEHARELVKVLGEMNHSAFVVEVS